MDGTTASLPDDLLRLSPACTSAPPPKLPSYTRHAGESWQILAENLPAIYSVTVAPA
jgi:hypothetical protein